MSGPRLCGRGLARRHGGVEALAGVDLEVQAGEVVAVVGGNGAGKSTLLDVLSGVTSPSAGTVAVDGRVVTGDTRRFARAGVARSFQTSRLVEDLSVDANVALGAIGAARPLGLMIARRSSGRSATAAAKEAVGLAVPGFRRAGGLSGGERKRVELARVLAGHPAVALLDEPLAGVAAADRAQLVAAVRALAAGGAAVVVVEHDLAAVAAMADRVVTLERGRFL